MKARKVQALQRQILRILNTWKDPHTDVVLAESSQIQGIDVSADGTVQLAVIPQRPHCPCCLFDLRDLRQKISTLKGVVAVNIHISGVPAAERWTRVLNPE